MANTRELVLKSLYHMEQEKAYANRALKALLQKAELGAQDRGFATELMMGVVRNQTKLDYIITRYSKIKIKKLSLYVHLILRMGIYQIVCMDHVPDRAACDESVKLAKRYAHAAAGGYVNGVLRSVSRTKAEITYPTDSLERLSVVYSCPTWLTQKLMDQYGEEECENILFASHQKQAVSLRVNTLRCDRETLIKKLAEEGVTAEADAAEPRRVTVDGAIAVGDSAAYRAGLFTPQNLSSIQAVKALEPQSGDLVLDVCAAPGGKTTFMAELMENRGRIYAFDIHPHKIDLIRRGADRLGITIIEAAQHDAAKVVPALRAKADKVLVDAPCSGIGVLYQKPDIKWRRTEEEVADLCALQYSILEAAAEYVKPGGTLVYSTCTILREENQDRAAAFSAAHPEYTLCDEQQLLTHRDGGSGFYIAKWIRRK